MNHKETLQERLDNPDFLVLSGSRLYGTVIEGSDYDYRGFVIPPFEYLVGVYKFDQQVLKTPDKTVWSLIKYIELLLKGDPNCIELLFAPPENIINISPLGNRILNIKDSFLSKRLIPRVIGYAISEYHHFIKDSTNFKRASHAVRLLDQVWELLSCQTLTFPRNNADELILIKNGDIDLFTSRFDELFKRVESMKDMSVLPDHPPVDQIKDIVKDILAEHLVADDKYILSFL